MRMPIIWAWDIGCASEKNEVRPVQITAWLSPLAATILSERNILAGLTGTATYEGPATGIVMSKANANATPELDYFNAMAI